MENLQQKIKNQIKEAMMAKDAVRLSVLRGLVSAFTNELVAKGRMPQDVLEDEETLAVIRRQVKQRKDAIEQFTTGGREDLAESEKAELVYLEAYLPSMMSEDDTKTFITNKQKELGITDVADKNKLISEVMKDLKGKADGLMVKNIIDSLFV
jgi:uncharacterized protein YqeY